MTKKSLKEYVFHSQELMPTSLSTNEEKIEWINNHSKGHRYKPGDEVSHRHNPDQVMRVKQIMKKMVKVRTHVNDENGKPVMQRKKKMEGVLCYWFE